MTPDADHLISVPLTVFLAILPCSNAGMCRKTCFPHEGHRLCRKSYGDMMGCILAGSSSAASDRSEAPVLDPETFA